VVVRRDFIVVVMIGGSAPGHRLRRPLMRRLTTTTMSCAAPQAAAKSRAARVVEPASGRVLEVWTTEPGVQFYTGKFSRWQNSRQGRLHLSRAATPSASKPSTFPIRRISRNSLRRPQAGERYHTITTYKFSVEK